MKLTIDELLTASPVIPVIVVENLDTVAPLATTLVDAGVKVLEVVMRTPLALDAIQIIRSEVDGAIVGAGTVTNPNELDKALTAGSQFVVTPGSTQSLLKAGIETEVPVLPGIASASELMQGLEFGYREFKFFPAEYAGGAAMLKALQSVFGGVRFCPTGGINKDNMGDYLSLSSVSCVGGSWLTPADLVARQDWQAILELAQQTLALADQ